MTQLGLDWNTRRASAEALEKLPLRRVREDHRLILAALAAGPLSDGDLLEHTGIHPNAIRARRGELVGAGYLKASGYGIRNGRKVTLWGLHG